MKYKELYISAQQRFAKKLSDLRNKYSDIKVISGNIEYVLEYRRDELSPELYKFLIDNLVEIDNKCLDIIGLK